MTDALSPSVLAALTRIGIVLAHFVWQGTAVAAIVAILMRLLRHRLPGVRYTTLVAGLIVMATLPIFTLCCLSHQHSTFAAPIAHMAAPTALNDPVKAELTNETAAALASSSLSDADPPAAESAAQPLPESTFGAPNTDPDLWRKGEILTDDRLAKALSAAALLWSAGVLALAVRLSIGWLSLHRLRNGTDPLTAPTAAIVQQLCDRLGLEKVRVFATRAWSEPVALGLLRPVVLLPISVITQCPPELIEAVIAHELAHIRRYDLWVNLLQRIVETLLFYHPAVWWISSRIRAERELCCDDLAISITRKRADYASALVEISRIARGLTAPPLAAGLVGSRLSIVHRARRVLEITPPSSQSPRVSFWLAGPLALALAGMIGLLSITSPAAMSASTQPAGQDSQQQKGPVDTKTFDFSWNKTPFLQAVEDLSRMTGLSIRGLSQLSKNDVAFDITCDHRGPMDFDQALLLFDRLIERNGLWLVHRDEFLDLQRITEFYRSVPPKNVFTSTATYRDANLPGWEWTTVFYHPTNQPAAVLATFVMDNVPENLARAGVSDDGRLELKGIVYYINEQLQLLQRMDVPAPASMPAQATTGQARLGPDSATPVRTLVDGIVLKVFVTNGQEVKADTPIAQLDDAEIELELRAAESKLDAAKEALDDAQREMKAGAKPYSPAVTRTLEQEIKMAEIERQRWALRLARTRISSPAAGKVILIPSIGVGAKINAGDTVATILPPQADLDASKNREPGEPAHENVVLPEKLPVAAPTGPRGSAPFQWPAAPQNTRGYEVRSQSDSLITKIHAEGGDQVKAGDVIAELDNEETTIELEAARIHLDAARRELQVLTHRVAKGLAVSTEEGKAQEVFQLAELDVKRLELRLARTQIKAPLGGTLVTGPKWREGTRVQAGDEVARIRATLPTTKPADK